jgi:hypothetical protein
LRIWDVLVSVSSSKSSLVQPVGSLQQSASFQPPILFQTQSNPPLTADHPLPPDYLRYRSFAKTYLHGWSCPFHPLHPLIPQCDSAIANCKHLNAAIVAKVYWSQRRRSLSLNCYLRWLFHWVLLAFKGARSWCRCFCQG